MSKSIGSCSYFPQCRGCSLWDMSYQEQQGLKQRRLAALLSEKALPVPEIGFISLGERELRHRVDFTLQFDPARGRHIFGFYDQNKTLLQIETCLQLAPGLQEVYREFRSFHFYAGEIPLRKGSVRLRIGPAGHKGCWLDFANADLKALLDDGRLLNSLLAAGFEVEAGQKGKRVVRRGDGTLKLVEPRPGPWFETPGPDGERLPLHGLISDFTQPSWHTAAALVETVAGWLGEISAARNGRPVRILEFGPGLGQFTLNFLRVGFAVTACEVDLRAVAHLRENADRLGLGEKLRLLTGDFHRRSLEADNEGFDVAFVNPARSGLKGFTREITAGGADYLIYVSCFPESMAEDLQALSADYRLTQTRIADQFPQTEHFETLVFLERIRSESKS